MNISKRLDERLDSISNTIYESLKIGPLKKAYPYTNTILRGYMSSENQQMYSQKNNIPWWLTTSSSCLVGITAGCTKIVATELVSKSYPSLEKGIINIQGISISSERLIEAGITYSILIYSARLVKMLIKKRPVGVPEFEISRFIFHKLKKEINSIRERFKNKSQVLDNLDF